MPEDGEKEKEVVGDGVREEKESDGKEEVSGAKKEESQAGVPEADEFGLPTRPARRRTYDEEPGESSGEGVKESTGDVSKEDGESSGDAAKESTGHASEDDTKDNEPGISTEITHADPVVSNDETMKTGPEASTNEATHADPVVSNDEISETERGPSTKKATQAGPAVSNDETMKARPEASTKEATQAGPAVLNEETMEREPGPSTKEAEQAAPAKSKDKTKKRHSPITYQYFRSRKPQREPGPSTKETTRAGSESTMASAETPKQSIGDVSKGKPKGPKPGSSTTESTPADPALNTASAEPSKPRVTTTEITAAKPGNEETTKATPNDPTPTTLPPSTESKPDSTPTKPPGQASEWSHQQLAPHSEPQEAKSEDLEWQEMPALATFRQYDDWGKVTAQAYDEVDDETMAYGTLGGAAKGYTRVQADEDAQSATSLDDNTAYLFKEGYARNALDEEDEARDLMSQMQTTKEMLTEGQRVAYVGVVRLCMVQMVGELEGLERTKGARRVVDLASEAAKMWAQKMMVRLYGHMEISTQEQVMVEQLAEHGLKAEDLTPALMQNARVKNPEAEGGSESASVVSARASVNSSRPESAGGKNRSSVNVSAPGTPATPGTPVIPQQNTEKGPSTANSVPGTPAGPGTPTIEEPPPAYEEREVDNLHIENPDDYAQKKSIDLDIRWTVLCDLFLMLIADSIYDARSRTLLERVGAALSVEWQDVCRFEKRVTDALEMQEQADKENWNEDEHLAARQKSSRNRRLMVMGICTVGGGLVIGLSAGLLAPVIGAGLAAGFTSIGVAGTSSFFAGTGAAALIGTTGALTGANIGINSSRRRTGAVRTFEYRPLHNNKRVNLIVTVAGWMTGNVDDVRLPFSTVDPVMGDIYSVHWEPEMLRSTGQTIQILGTEALTQTVQQVLGATLLTTLMAGLSAPLMLTKLAYLIDNPWTVSCARADAAGLILADSLIDRNLGVRPITLVGFSLGARVIFSALRELAARGGLGLIQNVYLFGTPVVSKKDEYLRARSVVSGRFVNGYATNDWILGYLFRATNGGIMRVAGLSAINVPGIENLDCTDLVPGHMAYRAKMPLLLRMLGWAVDSDEFSEIEDPDPENHEKRQRELISEIEEARRQLEAQKVAEEANGAAKKGGFLSRFTRRKAPAKKSWETYDEKSLARAAEAEQDPEAFARANAELMFDVDAIRREALALATRDPDSLEEIKAHLSIREIESTLPVLRIASPAASPKLPGGAGLRHTQSFHGKGAGSVGGSATPPPPQQQRGPWAYDDEEDGGVRMSFGSPGKERPGPAYGLGVASGERPPLRSVATSPSYGSPAMGGNEGGENPWADEDEESGRRGKGGVEMSFE